MTFFRGWIGIQRACVCVCVCDKVQLLKTNAGMQEEAATEEQTGK